MDSTVITWIVTAIGFVLNAAVVAAVTVVVTRNIEKRYQKRDQAEADRRKRDEKLAELQEANKVQQMEEMMNKRCDIQVQAIREEMQKVHEQLHDTIMVNISKDLGELKDSTLCSLRDDILNSYWRCHDWQKFRSEWDTSNMESLYEQYHRLHGNSFVDHLMEEFYKIPLK